MRHFPSDFAAVLPALNTMQGCTVVGIGASAGGLEAFLQLLKHLPADTGLGFVFVQHLDPLHKSSLREIFARATAMTVQDAANNQRVLPNHVYVIPPNKGLTIVHGKLKIRPRFPDRGGPFAIDAFLESLAQSQRSRAIGVILSGSGTDGSAGLRTIKAAGGVTFAQDKSAKYAPMPRNAIDTACVDFVLSPAKIAAKLVLLAKQPASLKAKLGLQTEKIKNRSKSKTLSRAAGPVRKTVRRLERPSTASEVGRGSYHQILELLHKHSRLDFAYYKSVTLHRRIKRRILLTRCENLESYLALLKKSSKEIAALYADVLINVTSFFRNPEAFDTLTRKVFPKLLRQKGSEPIRVWVPGCSTGQEAYTVAMSFAAAARGLKHPRKLKIFATDVSEANLNQARRGFYGRTLVEQVPPCHLRTSFAKEEGGYRVIQTLREAVVFARHDLTSDPPFSRMDLVSCRNLMIYLEPALQKKVITTLLYALKPGGFLFLGAAESLGPLANRFVPVEGKQRIFSKKALSLPVLQRVPARKKDPNVGTKAISAPETRLPVESEKHLISPDSTRVESETEREADRVSVKNFAPPGVLINAELQIVQFRGATGAYLEPHSGKASFDLLTMVREGLRGPLRETIERAKKRNLTVRTEGIPVERNGLTFLVNVEIFPLRNLKEKYCLVFFDELSASRRTRGAEPSPVEIVSSQKDKDARFAALERDLSDTRDYLQSVRDHQESATEELQAANEEGQSANEELQSLNEELETSKEELESTNEELITVNEEMTNRNTELDRLNSDLTNLQSSTKLIVVLFGADLTVRRFSEQAQKTFNLRSGDVGKPIRSIQHNLNVFDLEAFVRKAVGRERLMEHQIQGKNGRWYSVRVSPYVTTANERDGAVLLLVDIDDLKKAAQIVVEARAQLATYAEGLEVLAERRTAELVTTNKTLEGVVHSAEKGKEEFRKLFLESQVMQKKLRLLTHQIIAAQEGERKQISRELHDEVVQALIAVSVELSTLAVMSLAVSPAINAKIVYIKGLVENSVNAVHRFARGLRPAVLDDLGLIPAIHAYCRNLAATKNIKIEIRAFRGVETLGEPERTTLFRVAQEALTNVVRHAKASRVTLSIDAIHENIRMRVSDNGRSFIVPKEPGALSNQRLGLVGMRERVEMVGGTLNIRSAKSSGTTVEALIPFSPQASPQLLAANVVS